MKKDFTTIDNAIVRYLDGRPVHHPINSRELAQIAAPFATLNYKGEPDSYRLIDRRLQALRKKGIIYPDRKAPAGWRLVKESA